MSNDTSIPRLLDGKVALVTGAAMGFGSGIARALGRGGARVCATDVNEVNLAQSLADMESDGSEVISRRLDAGNLQAFKDTVGEVMQRWGRLDAVVHAGVIMPLIPFEETSEEQWWKELRISLGGIINSTRVAWDIMKDQGGGHVIGIASGSSFRGYKNEVIYCAGKHGVEGFVKAVSLEAVPYGIALNAVGPGKRIKPTGLSLEQLEQTPNAVKSAWTDPADLGKAFVWLASQPSDRYSGLRFDAGPIIDTIAAEGWDFKFSPKKVTMYPDDISYRLEWQHHYDELEG